jgi:hypothetical protein
VLAEHHLLDRVIVGEHGDNDFALCGIGRRLGKTRTPRDQYVRFGGRNA